jgi:beta-glucanase (GH16 family)
VDSQRIHNQEDHQYTGSAPRNMGVHITDDFHTYRVDWNPKKMIFYFDDQPYWSISLDRIMQSPFYKEKGQPFDQEFYLILNVAVGGHFLEGPDPWDEWFYPEAEMWVDWVKFYDLDDIGDLPDYECVANPHATTDELCGATNWACYEQSYAWMGDVCDDSWKKCCQRFQCSHQEVVDQCSKVFAQYDSQLHDDSSCDFGGAAIKDWGY